MRTIIDHRLNGLNEAIAITATDEPGPGGANHCYLLETVGAGAPLQMHTLIQFQQGSIAEAGVNGWSNEALVAIVIDRLRGFQHLRKPDGGFDTATRGDYASPDNALALNALEDALRHLQRRTRERIARGVEGTSTV